MYTVNSEIFARILFSRKALKDIFVTLKIRDFGMIYLHQKRTKEFFAISRGFYLRETLFLENKTLAKISEFTVTFFKHPHKMLISLMGFTSVLLSFME